MEADDDVRSMFDSTYLGSWDLEGQDRVVTITKVVGGEVISDKGKARKPIVSFKENPKALVLNKTNMRAIKAMYGSFKARAWLGKQITLYPTRCMVGAEEKDCIRVRPNKPTSGKATGVPQEREPGSDE